MTSNVIRKYYSSYFFSAGLALSIMILISFDTIWIISFMVSNGSSFLNCPSNYSCIDILTRSNIYSVVIFTTIVVTKSIIILSLLLPLVILPDHDDFVMTSLRHYDATFTPWRSLQLNNRNPLCRNQHIIWESLLVQTFLILVRRLRFWRRRQLSISWSCGQIRFCQQCNSDRWDRVMSNSSSIKLSWKWEIVIIIFQGSNGIYIYICISQMIQCSTCSL